MWFRNVVVSTAAAFVLTIPAGAGSSPQSTAAKPVAKQAATAKGKTRSSDKSDASDIATAVKAAAAKDCGCGACAAKGCEPCHGKNCYFCVAKGLATKECGCGSCDAKGCNICGPGCDVCKFHLGPVAAATAKLDATSKK